MHDRTVCNPVLCATLKIFLILEHSNCHVNVFCTFISLLVELHLFVTDSFITSAAENVAYILSNRAVTVHVL
jgi:hypothetical protein